MKIPVLRNFRIVFKTGLQFNLVRRDYRYLTADGSKEVEPLRKSEINWGKLTNDIAISYLF